MSMPTTLGAGTRRRHSAPAVKKLDTTPYKTMHNTGGSGTKIKMFRAKIKRSGDCNLLAVSD